LGFVMGYFAENINDIWGWITMGLGAGIAIPKILRLYWWRFNAGGVVIGTVAGLGCAVIQRLIWPDLDERLQFLILSAISLTCTIIGTFLTRPTDRAVLENFYRITRPFGLWGPLKKTLPPDVRKATTREHVYDLVAVPFVFFWQVTLFLLPMQLIIHAWRSAAVTAVIFAVSLTGVYVFWYRKLPPGRVGPPGPAPAAESSTGVAGP
jgi:hypothetical protein